MVVGLRDRPVTGWRHFGDTLCVFDRHITHAMRDQPPSEFQVMVDDCRGRGPAAGGSLATSAVAPGETQHRRPAGAPAKGRDTALPAHERRRRPRGERGAPAAGGSAPGSTRVRIPDAAIAATAGAGSARRGPRRRARRRGRRTRRGSGRSAGCAGCAGNPRRCGARGRRLSGRGRVQCTPIDTQGQHERHQPAEAKGDEGWVESTLSTFRPPAGACVTTKNHASPTPGSAG